MIDANNIPAPIRNGGDTIDLKNLIARYKLNARIMSSIKINIIVNDKTRFYEYYLFCNLGYHILFLCDYLIEIS